MSNQRITVATTLAAVGLAAFGVGYLLLQSTSMGAAAAVALIGMTVIFVDPFVGLVTYLLFLYTRPQDYVLALQNMPIMVALSVATFGLMVLHMAVRHRMIVLAKVPQNLLMVWFYAAIIMSHVVWLNPATTIEATMEFLPTLVMYFLVSTLVSTHGKLKFTVNLIVIGTLFLAITGFIQYFTGTGLGGKETYEGRIQAVGIFSDPNDLGLALVVVLPFFYLKLTEDSKLWQKPLALIGLGIILYALFLTQSRGGILALGVILVLLLTRRLGRTFGMVTGAVVFLAIFALAPRMGSISTEEASAHGRVEAWSVGLDLFETYPIFGVGMNNFTQYHFRTAHNSFVLCATELGMFGLYPWIMLIYLSIKNNEFVASAVRGMRMRDVAVYVETIRYGLIAFSVGAYFLSRTYNEVLFLFVGLSAAVTNIFVKESSERYLLIEKRDWINGLLWTAGAWVITKMFLIATW
ncbi:MAG TPA: O-antigen ligase family protein [Candidatus Krumholzibacteria bacterium]|nr:O-antigen ligase family protein [Candidatus Krumholzibacteria bacterium]